MKYRQLGSSELEVSEISLGTWLTTGVGIGKETAIACIDRAFDLGINFIDTANAYGRGASERVIGEALKDRARDSYVLATKVYFPMSDTDRGLAREQIVKQIDASLGRLRTGHVDLYQCHRYDENTPLEETMTALTDIVKAGKVRYIGFSEWEPDHIRAALDMVPGVEKFVSSQPQYSLLWRRPEKAVIPLCKDNGISQIVWSPLGQGVLTGKYDADGPPPEDSRAASDDMGGFMERLIRPGTIRAVDEIRPLAEEAGCTMAQFALAWILREPNMASAIVGASRPDQLDDNAAASGLEIDPGLFARAEQIVAAIPRP